MQTRAYDRSTDIAVELGRVADYVSRVPNLPTWTTFFRSVGDGEAGRYAVDTLMGPAETWIEPLGDQRQGYAICSLIGGRLEQADLTLEPGQQRTRLTFTIRLPEQLPADRVERQLGVLEQELDALRALLEGEARR